VEVVSLAISTIQRDTSKFQFRSAPFVEKRVQWLVDNWNDAIVDPLDVWRFEGVDYLLSGHHRLEGGTRKGKKYLPARVHEITLQQAQDLALASNANRLAYTEFEYCRCVAFLKVQGKSFTEIAEQLSITVGMAKKYYGLRHLAGTDWERQFTTMDLASRAYAIGEYCEQHPLSSAEVQSLFELIVGRDLKLREVNQLLRDLSNHKASAKTEGTLFDLSGFTSNAAAVVKERNFLDQCAAETWWIYDLLDQKCEHEFPPELKAEFMRSLQKFYGYCVGSDDPNIIPQRASKKSGRSLRVAINSKAA
jgi:hypothetical protein